MIQPGGIPVELLLSLPYELPKAEAQELMKRAPTLTRDILLIKEKINLKKILRCVKFQE